MGDKLLKKAMVRLCRLFIKPLPIHSRAQENIKDMNIAELIIQPDMLWKVR